MFALVLIMLIVLYMMILDSQIITHAEIKKIYGAHKKNLNEDRSILLAAKCRQ